MRESDVIVNVINKSLRDLYGSDIVTGQSIFRVVWSEDQFEKRYGTFDDITPNGIFIRQVTEVREVPKYKQWIHQKHLLERLVLVPDFQQSELAEVKISYEPLWVFENKRAEYLPPTLNACQFIIDGVLTAQNVHKMMITGSESVDRPIKRYTDEAEGSQEAAIASKEARIQGFMEELFGDESGLSGASLDCGTASFVPHTYTKEK